MCSANTNTKQSAMHGSWPSQLITQDVCWLIISTQTDTKLSHRTSGTLPSCPLSLEYILALLCTHQWRLQHQATRSHHVGHRHPHQHQQIKTTMPRQQRNMTNAWRSANTNTKQSALHGSWPSQLITQDVCWLIISTQTTQGEVPNIQNRSPGVQDLGLLITCLDSLPPECLLMKESS